MKSTLSFKVGVAFSLAALFGLPLCAQAQYGPSSGIDTSSIPAAYQNMIPSSGTMGGPPADVQAKMADALARLKKNTKGMQHAIDAMNKAVAGVTAIGYSTPADIAASIAKAVAAIKTIQNATTLDDSVQNAIDDFSAFTDVLDANIENLMLLSKFPHITAASDRAMTRLQKFFDDTKARLADAPIDMTDNFNAVKAKVDALNDVNNKAKDLAKSGKAQEAFDMLENNFFPGLEDASQSIGLLNAIKGISRASIGVSRGIKTAQKIVDRVKGQGIDMADAQAIVDEASAKLVDFTALIKTPGFDLDKAMSYLEDLDKLRDDFMNKVDDLVGTKDVGKLPSVKFVTTGVPSLPMPMEMRNGFDAFRNKVMNDGGVTKGETPSEAFGIDANMMDFGASGEIPAGYAPSGTIPITK
jgi:hypothetical protein